MADHEQKAFCRLCSAPLDGRELDLGPLPIANRFTTDGHVDRHPLAMSACLRCGMIQLSRSPSPRAITPRVPWIRYNEPAEHLDDALAQLALPESPRVLGTGPFDQPMLDRLTRDGGTASAIELRDRAEDGMWPYLETLALRLSDGTLSARSGSAADIVVCRYLLEHTHEPLAALRALGEAATPDGVVMVEVPDCSSFLQRRDYSFPWEEHATYFTEHTLVSMARRAGFEVISLVRSPGALEDALLAVLRKATAAVAATDDAGVALFDRYIDGFSAVRNAWRRLLESATRDGKRVAVFGAGHQAIMFVNALGLSELVAAMVDDNVDKAGLVPPGLASPVISSAAMLADSTITTCLLAVSPRAEMAIRAKCASFVERGGEFHSIFASPVPS